ncbi:hypothetical protein JTE90_004012 [Oedothorax gibbosus]|uniref:Reverse transcriptase domain-containing protein n=1 Tax=Oedothorax gibbosus TaxID=931172 RepID=A0AAV6U5R1_9ARAC|nr:hypothetical protein JTE90_004012 [Oedothorax gibbosus]
MTLNIDRGCPQGPCLGSTLWNFVADDLLEEFSGSDADVIAYADDFVILFSAGSRRALEAIGNSQVNNFVIKSESLGLTISREKTTGMIFGGDLSNSMSSVMALGSLYPRSPIINEIRDLCITMEDRRVNIYWVKAHVGYFGNEVADSIAGAAVDLVASSLFPVPLPVNVLNAEARPVTQCWSLFKFLPTLLLTSSPIHKPRAPFD